MNVEVQDNSLRDLVEKNIGKGLSNEAIVRNDLIKNFHWSLMRARRMKHFTQKQLAEHIHEVEKTIHLAEKGVLPAGYDLVRKLENALEIRLIKPEIVEKIMVKENSMLGFGDSSKGLTIADLKKIKQNKEENNSYTLNKMDNLTPEEIEMQPEFVKNKFPDVSENNLIEKKDLSVEDIDDLIFGRK